MERIYPLFYWLNSERAVNWLQSLVGAEVTLRDLLDLCELRHCNAYMKVDGLRGFRIDGDDDDDEEVIGSGIHMLRSTGHAYTGKDPTANLVFEGPVFLPSQPEGEDEALWCNWEASCPLCDSDTLFKQPDIQALANRMNGIAEHVNDANKLREQLKQEHQARAPEEVDLATRRAEDGTKSLAGIRHMLAHTPEEFATMQKRAEEAERMVADLDRQLAEQAERERRNEQLLKAMTERLAVNKEGAQPDSPPEAQPGGLTFPYTTRMLEAMRRASAEFWEEYTPDKRQPTQKAIGLTLGELLELPRQSNGDPARKAIALASAIRPDDLPSA